MQNKLYNRLVSIFLYLILAVSVVFLLLFYIKKLSIDLPEKPTFQEEIDAYGPILDLIISWAYVLIGIAAAAAIIPAIVQLFTRPKNAIKSVVSVVIIGVLVLIAYSMSDGTPMNLIGYTGTDNVPPVLKFADTMLFTMYFLLVGAIISIFYAEISKIFK